MTTMCVLLHKWKSRKLLRTFTWNVKDATTYAREDDGETEKKRQKERKKKTETMIAARHDRIIILLRMARVYASTVRNEK